MNDDEEVPTVEDKKIPKFLLITYTLLMLGGLVGFYLYWNGSHGFLDRGHWQELQRAAKTTVPFEKSYNGK